MLEILTVNFSVSCLYPLICWSISDISLDNLFSNSKVFWAISSDFFVFCEIRLIWFWILLFKSFFLASSSLILLLIGSKFFWRSVNDLFFPLINDCFDVKSLVNFETWFSKFCSKDFIEPISFSNFEILLLIFDNWILLVSNSDCKEFACLLRALYFGLLFP